MPNRFADELPPQAVVDALREASRRLRLPEDVDERFQELLERELDPAVIVDQMAAYLANRSSELTDLPPSSTAF